MLVNAFWTLFQVVAKQFHSIHRCNFLFTVTLATDLIKVSTVSPETSRYCVDRRRRKLWPPIMTPCNKNLLTVPILMVIVRADQNNLDAQNQEHCLWHKQKTSLSLVEMHRSSVPDGICKLIPTGTGKILAKLSDINKLVCSTAFHFFLSYFELIFPLAEVAAYHKNNITAQCAEIICMLYL